MDSQSLAEPNTILRGLVGSTVHGLSVSDQDDRDEMGICVEPWEHFFGLRVSKVSEAEVLAEATEIEAQLVRQRNAHPLGPANVAAVERFVLDAYLSAHPWPRSRATS